jgi:hypothetical protein
LAFCLGWPADGFPKGAIGQDVSPETALPQAPEVNLLALPINTSFGLSLATLVLQSGGQLVLPDAPDPEPILEAMAQTSAQALYASARQLADLLAYCEDKGKQPENAHLNCVQGLGQSPRGRTAPKDCSFSGSAAALRAFRLPRGWR